MTPLQSSRFASRSTFQTRRALDQVDRHFEEILAVDELDEHRLDLFADAIAELPGASRYASALHEYGVAILVKDRAVGQRTHCRSRRIARSFRRR